MAKDNKNILDKSTPIPLYFQLKEIIKDKIESGELEPGEMIPSERELEEKYKISRPTIRQGLKELVNEGLLFREKGRGTFVSKPKIDYSFIQKFTTFYDDMEKKGYETKTEILKQEVKKCKKPIANKLNIEPGEKIIFLNRLRYIEDDPIVFVINHIPYNLCPEIAETELENKSLYRTMKRIYNITPYKAEISLEPIVADEYDSKLLEVEKGFPLHLMRNITYTEDNKIMDYFESHFRGDKGKVRVELYND